MLPGLGMEDINDQDLPLHASNSRSYNVSLFYAMPDCRRPYQVPHPCQPPTRRYPMRNVKPPVRILNVSWVYSCPVYLQYT